MKIAIVMQPWDQLSSTTQNSSISIIAYQLALRLTPSSDVTIYAMRGSSQSKVELDASGVRIRRMRSDTERKLLRLVTFADRKTTFRNPARSYYGRSWYHLGYFLQVANDLRKQRYDIVHIINFSQLVPLVRSLNPKVKIVLHMHCEWLTQLDQTLIGPRLEETDLIIGCSHYVTDKICDRFPHLAHKCQTIHNGVATDKFSCEAVSKTAVDDGVKKLLYVGRLSPEKGLHVLLEAFQLVVQRYPGVQLDIVGPPGEAPVEFTILVSDDDKTAELTAYYSNKTGWAGGGYFSYLQQQLPADIAAKVFFRGNVGHSELVDYYCNADLFVFPSVWHEPFGIPLIEAMACKVPVVATRSGGMTEIVKDGETGLIVERGDAESLAEALITLIADDTRRKAMGKAGRQRVLEHFTWDRMAESLLQHYQQLDNDLSRTSRPSVG